MNVFDWISSSSSSSPSPHQTHTLDHPNRNKTTNNLRDTSLTTSICKLCNLCMNWNLRSRAFIIYFSIIVFLFMQTSMINCNHIYGITNEHDRNSNKDEESISLVERHQHNSNDGTSSYLSMQSLRAYSLTSLNQMRMFEEKAIPKNVTAQIGRTVYMHCIVEPIGDKMVSWIRLRDFHLLTVGLFTYTSDTRFIIRFGTLQSNDWALEIKHVAPGDQGLYECQVNTDPPRSQYYYLHVVVPVANIVGYPNMFVKSNGEINLTCIITRSPEPPVFVFWYHNDRMINYDYNLIGRLETSLHKDLTKSDTVISRLVISNAKGDDNGNYTCSPSNSEPASIYVHVLQGEKRLSDGIQNYEPAISSSSSNQLYNGGRSTNRICDHLTTCTANLNNVFILIIALIEWMI